VKTRLPREHNEEAGRRHVENNTPRHARHQGVKTKEGNWGRDQEIGENQKGEWSCIIRINGDRKA